MAAPQYTTLIEIVNNICLSVGHPQTQDVAGSLDEAIRRMVFYANLAGAELTYIPMGGWQKFQKTATISIVADFAGQTEKAFDLPPDFKAMIDDTHWDRATQLPALGPVNPQDWQWLVVRNTQVTTRFMWRLRDGKLWVKSPPAPGAAQDLSFEYVSKFWAREGTADTPQETMIANADYHVYPWQLMLLYTRAKWFENEGYDSVGAYSDFQRALNYELGTDKGATALSLVPGRGFPYLNAGANLPSTGYGNGY